ncbi:MAG: EamA family transporter [Oscillospiraceae bacterium]|nr:EamA family transporter [Oscillospiraceae bacterium]
MKKYVSYAYVLLGATCWGFIGVFNRLLASAGVDMANRVFVRNFFSLLLLTLVFALFRRDVFHVKPRDLPIFAASGLLSILTLSWAYFNCQMECSLAVAAILLYLAPSMVVVMSALLWKTPITRRKGAALLLSLLGCALVSGVVGGALTGTPRGLLLGVASAFCYATYTIFAHYGLARYDAYTMIYWTFVFAGLGSLLFLDWGALAPALATARGGGGAVGLVLVATVLPYLFYTKGLEGVEGGKAAILANVEPVVAALLGVALFHERLSAWVLLGVVCVLGGAALLAKEDTRGEA